MNYKEIYDNLISRGLERGHNKKNLSYYTERHHIIPKCMGGAKGRSNCVLLTAREHFIAHQLLYKIYKTPGLALALHRFYSGTEEQRLNSVKYEWIKRSISLERSKSLKSIWKNLSDQEKADRIEKASVLSKLAKENWTDKERELFKQNISNGRINWENSLSEEERENHWNDIVSKRNKTLSDKSNDWHKEYKMKISEGVLSIERKTCPHCDKTCDVGNYAKYHGDNCKIVTGKSHIREKLKCPHCDIEMDKSHAKRYHFDNCKKR